MFRISYKFFAVTALSLSTSIAVAQSTDQSAAQQSSDQPKTRVEVVRTDGSHQEVDPRLVRKVERKLEEKIDHVEQTGPNSYDVYRKKPSKPADKK